MFELMILPFGKNAVQLKKSKQTFKFSENRTRSIIHQKRKQSNKKFRESSKNIKLKTLLCL